LPARGAAAAAKAVQLLAPTGSTYCFGNSSLAVPADPQPLCVSIVRAIPSRLLCRTSNR
jgi:hypothetical protein